MAVPLQDLESWLPTEFLSQEELLPMDRKGFNTEFKPGFSFPSEFPYEFDSFGSPSSISSPGESAVGSTEHDSSSDEDDLLAGLTRRLVQQLAVKSEKTWALAGSPESTLSGIGSWSASSNGSPNGVLSPPTTPFGAKNDTWDLIYEAAGQVARLKMNSEANNRYSNYNARGVIGSARAPNPAAAVKNHYLAHCSSQSFAHDLSQKYQQQHHARQQPEQVGRPQCPSVWGRQQVKVGYQAQHLHNQQQQIQSKGCVRPLGLSHSAWPSLQDQPNQLQQHSSSGMRAVFLGGSGGVKRECAGTGVFLPRRYSNNPPESKKKPACSTVLLPAKVVQALNLNFDDMTHSQPRFDAGFASDYDVLLMARRNALLAQQRRSSLRAEGVLNHEIRLPQEWTY